MNTAQEQKLREFIQKGIAIAKIEDRKEKLNQFKSELRLRRIVKNLIKEASEVATGGQSGDEQRSTGINVLANVLKLVIPIIKQGYVQLTTSPEQKKSYRAHIVQNAINTLMRVDMASGRPTEVEMPNNPEGAETTPFEPPALEEPVIAEQDMTVDIDVEDDKFIDINPEEKEEPEPEEIEAPDPNKMPSARAVDALDKKEFVSIKGMDTTGMELAQRTFPKIQKQIADGYAMLSVVSDKEEFADYMVANLKLYFDQFDQESEVALGEPTSPEYEEVKGKMSKFAPAPEGATGLEGGMPPEGEGLEAELGALQEANWFVHVARKLING